MLRTTLPYIAAGSVHCSSTLVDSLMAGRLSDESVAVLSYSDKVCSIILSLTAVAATETLFPYFSDTVARRDWAGLGKQLQRSIGVILAAALPIVLFLLWQAEWVISLLFQRKAFTADATAHVAAVLRYAVLQIPFFIAGGLMAKVVVSLRGASFLLMMAFVTVVANALLNAWLMRSLGVAGIALSTAIVHAISTLALFLFLRRALSRRISGLDGDA